MSEPRRHHYVPQFYLKRFADTRGKIVQVRREDGKLVATSTVGKTAASNDFYTVELDDGAKSQEIEKFLSKLEADAAPIIEAMVSGNLPENEAREHLAIFLALQMNRGHDVRDLEQQAMTAITRMILRVAPPEYIRETLREKGIEIDDDRIAAMKTADVTVTPRQNRSVEMMLRMAVELAPHFLALTWHIVRFERPMLLTSDRPVTLWRRPSGPNDPYGVGIATAEEIHFPISPKMSLLLRPVRPVPEGVLSGNAKVAQHINRLVATQAFRWIYHTPGLTPLQGIPLHPHGPRVFSGLGPAKTSG